MKTGEFARLAGVTEKTLRYYDKIGLLKPAAIQSNGYRSYSEKDLIKLQRILFLKQLDFSLDDIYAMTSSEEDLVSSFHIQKQLIDERIDSLETLSDALGRICQKKEIDWSGIIRLIQLSSEESKIAENYKNSQDLSIRIALHERFSQNPVPWFAWVMEHLRFQGVTRILEIGCGNGKLWNYANLSALRNREVFLTDKSRGMIAEVRRNLGKDFNCIAADCQQLPFKNDNFNMVIANHVLFYLDDIHKGMEEITRVLAENGTFYCTTYGKNHMKEITELCQAFDPAIRLSQTDLAGHFGLENGEAILKDYFSSVTRVNYEDKLVIDKVQPLVDYVLSCHGNQRELILPRLKEFRAYLNQRLKNPGPFVVTKEAGMFICRKDRK